MQCSAACMRSLRCRIRRWSHISARVSPHEGERLDPSTEPSDRAEPVSGLHRLRLKAVQDELLAPTSPGRAPARGRRTGPRDCTADHAVRRPVSVQVPVLGAQEVDCPITGLQVAPVLEPADIRPVKERHPSGGHRRVRTGGPSFDANAAHPPPPVLGRANLGRARNGASFVHSEGMTSLGLGTGSVADSS